MQENHIGDTKSAVVEWLQDRLTTQTSHGPMERAPGSRDSINIEKAIDYTLSRRRKQSQVPFLLNDVLRNARLAVRRSTASETSAVAEIAAIFAPPHHAYDGRLRTAARVSGESRERPGARTSGPNTRIAGTAAVELTTPEDIAIAGDLEYRLRSKVAIELNPFASDVLEGMFHEETTSEAAGRLNVSPRTIDRTRRSIRTKATELLLPERSSRSAALSLAV